MSIDERLRTPALIVTAGCLIALMTMGSRAALGVFLEPMTVFHGWTREQFAVALAVQNLLWGVFQPFAGAIADRWGPTRVLAPGVVLYAIGLAAMAVSSTPFWLLLTAGLLMGVAQALSAFAIVFSAFGRLLPEARRSWAFGMVTAASSMGQFLVVPLGQGFIAAFGWQEALWLLGLCVLLTLPFTFLLATPRETGTGDGGATAAPPVPIGRVLQAAFGHRSYVLLVLGFFVCGFHVAFIAVHLPAYVGDLGLSPALGAYAVATIGLFNVVGSYMAGVMGATHSRKTLLCLIYLARAVVIMAFLAVPPSAFSVYLFAAAMGVLWLSTVPLTSGLVALMFGMRNMAMLFGIVFLSHQVGAFIGVWLGGYLFDTYGSYDVVWWLSVALGLLAALVHWPIREQAAPAPVARPA